MTTYPTDTYHHGDLHEACIAAGLKLLAEGGPDAVTIRGVARIAHVSHTAPLYHFADRDALLDAISQRGFDRLLDRLTAAAAAGDTGPRAQLRAYGLAYVEEAMASPGLFSLMFGRARDGIGETAGRRLVELCAEAIDAGELDGPDPQVLSLILWSSVHGLASLYVTRYLGQGFVTGEPADARAGTEVVLDALFASLTPMPAGRRAGSSSMRTNPTKETSR
jgi:AcrR family transcriptional regulator